MLDDLSGHWTVVAILRVHSQRLLQAYGSDSPQGISSGVACHVQLHFCARDTRMLHLSQWSALDGGNSRFCRQVVRPRTRTRRRIAGSTFVCALVPAAVPPAESASITSTSNTYVKHCVKLRTSRGYRLETQRLLLTGVAPLTEIAASCSDVKAHTLLVCNGDVPGGLPQAEKVIHVTPAVMRKLAGLDSPPTGVQVAAELDLPPEADFAAMASLQRLLVLEGVQDPGNMGTLLRTAAALGWQGAFLLPGCCDAFNDKALRAGRCASFQLLCATGSWEQLLRVVAAHRLTCLAAQLPERSGTSAPGGPCPPISRGLCLVLGSEGQGLSSTALDNCSSISVPMDGDMESLNVAVAGGILMFALTRAPESLSC